MPERLAPEHATGGRCARPPVSARHASRSSFTRFVPIALLTVASVVFTSAAQAVPWIEVLPSSGVDARMNEVEIDSTGAPIAVGPIGDALVVTKRNPANGDEIWDTRFGGEQWIVGRGGDVAIAADDDVIVVGSLQIPFGGERGLVARLDGTTGAVLWTWNSPYEQYFETFGYSALRDVTIDAQGNIYAVGSRSVSASAGWNLFVAKLSPSGQTLWLYEADGAATDETSQIGFPDSADRIELDAAGNPVVFGTLQVTNAPTYDAVAITLDGATGAQTWRQEFDFANWDIGRAMTLLPSGDIAAATSGYDTATVFVVTPGASQPSWVYFEPNFYQLHKWIHDLAAAPNGDVLFGGWVDGGVVVSMVVGRLSGTNGAVVWHRAIDDGDVTSDAAYGIDLAADGDLYVGGVRSLNSERLMGLLRLDGMTGATIWETLLDNGYAQWNAAQDIRVDDVSGTVFAGGYLRSSKDAWGEAAIVAVDAATGEPPIESEELDIFLIPLWDNWLLWLKPVEEIEIAYERALDLNRERREQRIVTTKPEMLLKAHDQAVELYALDGMATLDWILRNRDALGRRSAPAVVHVEQGSEAHHTAIELAEKLSGGDARRPKASLESTRVIVPLRTLSEPKATSSLRR